MLKLGTWNVPVASFLPQPATQHLVPVPFLNLNTNAWHLMSCSAQGSAAHTEL